MGMFRAGDFKSSWNWNGQNPEYNVGGGDFTNGSKNVKMPTFTAFEEGNNNPSPFNTDSLNRRDYPGNAWGNLNTFQNTQSLYPFQSGLDDREYSSMEEALSNQPDWYKAGQGSLGSTGTGGYRFTPDKQFNFTPEFPDPSGNWNFNGVGQGSQTAPRWAGQNAPTQQDLMNVGWRPGQEFSYDEILGGASQYYQPRPQQPATMGGLQYDANLNSEANRYNPQAWDMLKKLATGQARSQFMDSTGAQNQLNMWQFENAGGKLEPPNPTAGYGARYHMSKDIPEMGIRQGDVFDLASGQKVGNDLEMQRIMQAAAQARYNPRSFTPRGGSGGGYAPKASPNVALSSGQQKFYGDIGKGLGNMLSGQPAQANIPKGFMDVITQLGKATSQVTPKQVINPNPAPPSVTINSNLPPAMTPRPKMLFNQLADTFKTINWFDREENAIPTQNATLPPMLPVR